MSLALMGLVPKPPGATSGVVELAGRSILTSSETQWRAIRGKRIAMIFQDPMTSLNPYLTVARQLTEVLETHERVSRSEARTRSIEMLARVGIADPQLRIDAYPHELSGGMRQRVMIAMGIALDPTVLIADEPTTALDVTVQAQIMELLADLQTETGMGLILITHDLGVVAEVADRVVVMYAGREVEAASIRNLYADPRHPYTAGLMQSIPRHDMQVARLEPITGTPPDLMRIPPGCPFHPRCPHAVERCRTDVPELHRLPGEEYRVSACHFVEEIFG
jgi:oligopeptide transport system ATP-binding protein